MWRDAEAQNKLLEDLLARYAVRLDEQTQTINNLRHTIQELTHELQYYKAHSFDGSVLDEPVTKSVAINSATFDLAVPQVRVSLEDNPYEGVYHVVAEVSDKNRVIYSYHISKPALLENKDRVGMLTFLHRKVLEEMERQLKKLT